MVRNHARLSPPTNVRKYRNARSDASCTTSSASCSLPIRHRASRYAASRWGRTASSKVSFIERADDLLQAQLERGIQEPESTASQSNVREHCVAQAMAWHGGTGHEPPSDGGHTPDTKRPIREAREGRGELIHPDRIAVDHEVPA